MFSCNHTKVSTKTDTKDKIHKSTKATAVEHTDSLDSNATASDQRLRYYCLHHFSAPNTKDIFSIALYGKSIDSGKVIFKILDHTYHQIYSETFPSSDMLGDLIDDKDTKGKISEDTIKKRMAAFLDTTHFHSPAIDPNSKIEDDFEVAEESDIKNWKNVKSDPTSVAFIYSHGYEGTYGIAYSKKQKKVVLIFYSD